MSEIDEDEMISSHEYSNMFCEKLISKNSISRIVDEDILSRFANATSKLFFSFIILAVFDL